MLSRAADGVRTLPFTGANDLLQLVVFGLLLVLAGLLALGLARRHTGASATP